MKKILIILTALTLITSACKEDDERTSITGSWNCEEQSDINSLRTYQVNILQDPVNNEFYRIYNFHKLGQDEAHSVLCRKDAKTGNLIIENYKVENSVSILQATGIIADDFSDIKWTYELISTNGIKNTVKARYY